MPKRRHRAVFILFSLIVLAFIAKALMYFTSSYGPKMYTYYRITKVKNSSGLSLSKDLIESICLNKLLHFGEYNYSLSPSDMFSVGTGSRSGMNAYFFEMYPAGEMLIKYQNTDIREKGLGLLYGNTHLSCFSYKGTFDYFSPPSSDIVIKTVIKGGLGSITISIGNDISITLKVRESNDWNLSKDQMLDIGGLIEGHYPFDIAFKTIGGTIQYTNKFLQTKGQNSLINEPVKVLIAQRRDGDLFCLGFRCNDSQLQDPRGHAKSVISPLSREAGFASPVPIVSSNQTIICRTVGRGTIICGGGTDEIKLSFDADDRTIQSSPTRFFPYGIHWSSEIIKRY